MSEKNNSNKDLIKIIKIVSTTVIGVILILSVPKIIDYLW